MGGVPEGTLVMLIPILAIVLGIGVAFWAIYWGHQTKKLEFEYGSLKSSYKFDETTRSVISVARLELTEYKIPAAKFSAMRDFFGQVAGEYAEKIVVKKPE